MYMKHKNYLLFFIITLFRFMNAVAQPGTIDKSFNPLDSGYWKGNGLNGNVSESILQPDGKIIIVGSFSRYGDVITGSIARFNTDGTLDKTFKSDGTNFGIQKIVQQNDGKLLIGGGLTTYNGISRNGIARLNPDGSLDASFDPGSGFLPNRYTDVTALYILNDGKIMVGGDFTSYNGTNINRITRLQANGVLDTTFHVGTGASQYIKTFAQQADGKIIAGFGYGNASYNGVVVDQFMRLNINGTLDTDFKALSGYDAYSIIQQDDGKLIVGGYNNIVRLNADGTVDSTFKTGTGIQKKNVYDLAIQPDKKIIISGSFNTYNDKPAPGIARLNPDGSLDSSFNPGAGIDQSVFSGATIATVSLQTNGQFIIGGDLYSYNGTLRNFIARINNDGTLDKNVFNVNGSGLNGMIWHAAMQDDGKCIVGGYFKSYNGIRCNNILRLNTDGTFDNTFNSGTGTNDWVENIAIQPDGKILLGGYFSTYNGVKAIGVVRLNSDGSMDNSFISPLDSISGFNYVYVESVLLQPDGKIIVSGSFSLNGKNYIVARLLSNGQLDPSFTLSESSGYVYNGTYLQPDGKFILVGSINSFDGTSVHNIIRLNMNGTIDNTFYVATGVNSTIYDVGVQSDGKIILGGGFTSFDGVTVNRLARLNSNGTLDQTFNTGTGLNSSVWRILFQQNNKIILAGNFTSYNGTSANRIIRLNADGIMDNTFESGTGANGGIYALSLQKDGKIIIGGNFYSYNGTGRNCLARIYGDGPTAIDENENSRGINIYPNPNAGQFYVSLSESAEISITDVVGKVICIKKLPAGEETIDLTKEKNGIYFLKINTINSTKSAKVIISQ